MKTRFIKGITAICFAVSLLLSSCLKDDSHYFNPSDTGAGNVFASFPLGGIQNFSSDAVTGAGIDTVQYAINVASATLITTPVTITIGIDNSYIAPYNTANPSITYLAVPAAAVKLVGTTYTLPAGTSHEVIATFILDRTQLDPSQSYMLPIRIVSASVPIATNFSIHYFHVIGNDFAGTYVWDYRRYNNGLAGGTSGGTTLGQPGTINPVTPTEFQMLTGYNGQKVLYDVTFTRTVSGGIAHYTNWAVSFPKSELDKWAGAGITNIVPPAFTVPPPSDSTQPKQIEINYVSGGAFPRYIDDTYHK